MPNGSNAETPADGVIRRGQYVALGSSFAAGIGLGPRAPGSPFLCVRSLNGYPQQLARLGGLSLIDVSCSGATTKHILSRGRCFQRPQIDAVQNDTELVTLTIGGNDVGYIGDLTLLSFRARKSILGSLLRRLWKGPRPDEKRNFDKLQDDIRAILCEVVRRAPRARVVVVTYPAVLPPSGTCPNLQIEESEAHLMRQVGDRLAEATRNAAQNAGVTIVDLATLSAGHDACSSAPWVNGAKPPTGAPFHPNLAGAEATAQIIWEAIRQK